MFGKSRILSISQTGPSEALNHVLLASLKVFDVFFTGESASSISSRIIARMASSMAWSIITITSGLYYRACAAVCNRKRVKDFKFRTWADGIVFLHDIHQGVDVGESQARLPIN